MIRYELIDSVALPDVLVSDIDNANREIYLQSMEFSPDGRMHNIGRALLRAAERGVDTTVAFDDISLRSLKHDQDEIRSFSESLNQFQNGSIVILGQPNSKIPVMGRTHSKLYKTDRISYIGGGINLSRKGLEHRDFMLRTGDQKVSEILDEISVMSLSDADDTNYKVKLDDSNTVLIDGGKRYDSIILDSAIELVKDAQEAWYISQYSPAAALAVSLRRLKDKAVVKFNTRVSNHELSGQLTAMIDNVLTLVPNSYNSRQRLHAKCLVVRHQDGALEAICGSHNFSAWGVRFGTKEMSLQTSDQSICLELIEFIDNS